MHRGAASCVRHFHRGNSSQALNIIQGHLLGRSFDMLIMLCRSFLSTVEAWRCLWKGADLLLVLDLNVNVAEREAAPLRGNTTDGWMHCYLFHKLSLSVFGAHTEWFRVSLYYPFFLVILRNSMSFITVNMSQGSFAENLNWKSVFEIRLCAVVTLCSCFCFHFKTVQKFWRFTKSN